MKENEEKSGPDGGKKQTRYGRDSIKSKTTKVYWGLVPAGGQVSRAREAHGGGGQDWRAKIKVDQFWITSKLWVNLRGGTIYKICP